MRYKKGRRRGLKILANRFFCIYEYICIQKYLTVDGSLLAGSIGLEPILYATKKRCITIMLRPNVSAFYADFNCRASQKIAIMACFAPSILLGEKYEKI